MTESWIQVTVIFIGLIASVMRYEHRMTRLETKVDSFTTNGITSRMSEVERQVASTEATIQSHIGACK